MRSPLLLERVRLIGWDGLFLVTWIDHEASMVELAPLRYGEPVLENVPLHAVELLSEAPISPLIRE
ncbi:MAG TPA: hypothetical protein VG225_09460 [Terracidiphilus sp.]|nr:hypothetical protein [Terracidiphilus sp.]